LLLVSAQQTSALPGWAATHSGLSMVVAPTAEAAWRVWMQISACELIPVASGVSSIQRPRPPSANLAT